MCQKPAFHLICVNIIVNFIVFIVTFAFKRAVAHMRYVVKKNYLLMWCDIIFYNVDSTRHALWLVRNPCFIRVFLLFFCHITSGSCFLHFCRVLKCPLLVKCDVMLSYVMLHNMTPCVTYTKWSKSFYEIGHCWITFGLFFKAILGFKFSYENLFSFACEWKLIFMYKDEHQDSLCKSGQRWFRSGLLYCYGATAS